MSKKSQPKVSDLVEVLIQQITEYENTMKQRNEILSESISKLKYMKVDFNVEELDAMKKSNRQLLKVDFEEFHDKTVSNNQKLLKVYKKISSKKLLYFVIVNILFLSIAGVSIYIAVKNSVKKTHLETITKERDKLKRNTLMYDTYFSENQTEDAKFEKWLKNY